MMNDEKTFAVMSNRGFHITFPNGVTLSTQIGWGNYCENRDKYELSPLHNYEKTKQINHFSIITSKDAEIAIFDKDQNWITKNYLKSVGLSEDMVHE